MKRFEYKTITLNLKGHGIFGVKKADGFEEALNQQGEQGWRYVDTLSETGVYGDVWRIKLIFEKEVE